ncbi:MAG: DM13 domain-containing protein [Pseudomonadota bacterium]
MYNIFKIFLGTFAIFAFVLTVPVTAYADKITGKGQFTGASDHITTGGVSIVKTANGGAVVILDSDFSLDGAPDPRVGFGKDGKYVEATDLGELSSKTGLQVYVVPASVNVDDFNEVYIWCRKFAVPLGIASIN